MLEIKLLSAIAATCLICSGCAVDPSEDNLAIESEPLIEGDIDNCSYPEVGLLKNTLTNETCTATLVAPDMILSAAHCFDYGTNQLGILTEFRFSINTFCGTQTSFSIIRYKSFVDSETNDGITGQRNDVAIAQLFRSVPSPTASPMNFFSGGLPAVGTSVTDVGHGGRTLADCKIPTTDFQKGVSIFPLDVTGTNVRTLAPPFNTSVCPGDSGGPAFAGSNRRIFWVNSAENFDNPSLAYNWYGEVWNLTTQIEDYMANWSCPSGAWWDNTPVNKDQRYPYARVCGADDQNYECRPGSHQWQALGGSCGNTSCQCANGAAFGDVAISPDRTSCGSTVCGRDQLVYTCTSGGWHAEPGSRCGPTALGVTEDFSVMPAWTSSVNAIWGGAATWSIINDGQPGNALKAVRTSTGSSARVKVYPVSSNVWYTASIYMKVNNSSADFWAEAAIKPGSFSAANFDSSPGTWTMIKKFDKTTGGNGNVWNLYSVTFNSGANTQVSVGFKTGNLSGTAPTVRWDTLRIQ